MLCPDLEPSEGSLPLLSPPLGMWKLFPPFPLATVGNLAWVLFPLVLGTVLAGILVLELVALLALLAWVVAFEELALVAPRPGCWEGTAPFGTCGVTLGLFCSPLAGAGAW